MQLNLIDGWGDLTRRIIKQFLQVLNGKVRDADILDSSGVWQLLHLRPCLDEVPVW